MRYLFFACETGNTQVLICGSATATSGTDALMFLPTAALATSSTTTTLPTALVALNEVTTLVPAAVDFHDTLKRDKGFSFVCYRPSYRASSRGEGPFYRGRLMNRLISECSSASRLFLLFIYLFK
jgi:hypothetical protein